MVLVRLSHDHRLLSLSSEISFSIRRKSRWVNMSFTDSTFLCLMIFSDCSVAMWQVNSSSTSLLFPPGPNIWILLLLYLATQLPLAPSSWSTNWSDSLLSKKSLSTLHPPLPLQRLWPPFPHLSIPQFFFFHHHSDFVSDADTELWVPTIMVLLRLPYPHHLPYNKKHYLSSSTWKNCPSFLLL